MAVETLSLCVLGREQPRAELLTYYQISLCTVLFSSLGKKWREKVMHDLYRKRKANSSGFFLMHLILVSFHCWDIIQNILNLKEGGFVYGSVHGIWLQSRSFMVEVWGAKLLAHDSQRAAHSNSFRGKVS